MLQNVSVSKIYTWKLKFYICFLFAGTAMSSPQSEVDNCSATLDEKEDSYFNEIKNFISNTERNQMSPGSSEEG